MLESFISEEALNLHKEYLKALKLRYSVYEKSRRANINSGLKRGIRRYLREENRKMAELGREISLHEIFFSSFSDHFQRCNAVKSEFGSESGFLYELSRLASEIKDGFLVIYKERDRVRFCSSGEFASRFSSLRPSLALDLCEHAYFLDYGFDKDKYVSNALGRLNIGVLDRN